MKLFVFSSNSCVPCKILKENLKKNKIPFVEMNFDTMSNAERSWSAGFKIMSLPTLIFFDENKRVTNRLTGTVPVEIIRECLR